RPNKKEREKKAEEKKAKEKFVDVKAAKVRVDNSNKVDVDEVTKGDKSEKYVKSKTDNRDKIAADGIHICLLGACTGKKITRKQKGFLKKFHGKALKIDEETGCSIPSHS
ncbi:hypothetical protein BGZ49_010580, partial [Haplosporangium sp. Z 27]